MVREETVFSLPRSDSRLEGHTDMPCGEEVTVNEEGVWLRKEG